mgnify:FL=1
MRTTKGIVEVSNKRTDCAGQVVSLQHLNVVDLERVHEQILHSDQSHGVLQLEPHHVGLEEVAAFLQRAHVRRERGGLDIAGEEEQETKQRRERRRRQARLCAKRV